MHSLYAILLSQHARQLKPVRCAYSTIVQLHRYLEDVVIENNPGALIIESLPLAANRSARERARVRELARGERHAFFFLQAADGLNDLVTSLGDHTVPTPAVLTTAKEIHFDEHFLVIADANFSALLATVRGRHSSDRLGGDEVIWTFEPEIVYSALEYLMSRVGAENPYHATEFDAAVRAAMPKETSLQLTVDFTAKIVHLLQEQAAREIAVNRIATAIRESQELGVVLQKAVDEVGTALNVASCALRVVGQTPDQTLGYSYLDDEFSPTASRAQVMSTLDAHCDRLSLRPEVFTSAGDEEANTYEEKYPMAVVPLTFHETFIGALQVTAGDPSRVWQENELLLLRTVADQVAVAINHAGLFAQIKLQALTDPLTGIHNRRSFELQLDRDLGMAARLGKPVSLLMVDLDRFKELNDTAGHDSGDEALRQLAESFKLELRRADSASRFGGDEFALILPNAFQEGAQLVAERLRSRIEKIEILGFGSLSASIGIASYPVDGLTRTELIAAADKALYRAKRGGRNRVCVAQSVSDAEVPEAIPPSATGTLVESRL